MNTGDMDTGGHGDRWHKHRGAWTQGHGYMGHEHRDMNTGDMDTGAH